ncbi:MAG: MFS transporter [Kofleriaceae bacterium]
MSALRHRNYRLFFAGQGISLVGTWLTRFAMGYETFHISGSAFELGLVAFFSQAPTAFIAPVAGVLVDRWDRHRTLILTQVLAMLQSAALAAFALTDTMTVFHLMWLGAVQAVINAFDMPARQSFVRQMVDDRADLPNAIALNSALVNVARLIGPVVAAALVALVGVGWCFGLDAISYVAVILSLVAMRVPKQSRTPRTGHIVEDMLAGFAYVKQVRLVGALLLLLAVTCTFGGAFTSLLPAVTRQDAHALGYLMAWTGAGALVGTLYLVWRKDTHGFTSLAATCSTAMGIGLVTLELCPNIWIMGPVVFVTGSALIVQWAATNTVVQTLVDEAMLGRVMSIYALVFFASAPVGALLEGALAQAIGPIHTYAVAGALCLVCSIVFRARLRSVLPQRDAA